MSNRLADAPGVSGGCHISRTTLRVNGSGKLGTRPTNRPALPGNSKSFRPKSTRKKNAIPTQTFFQQNVRGLKSHSAVTELIDSMRCRSGFSLGVQETWRSGIDEFTEDGYTFLGVGPDSQTGRGSCGVGILLSPAATVAWRASSGVRNLHNDLGPRIIAVRMLVADPSNGKPMGIFQISAYAPTSDASDDDKSTFERNLTSAIARRKPGDLLIICADANASIGKGTPDSQDENDRHITVGPHGLLHLNDAGRRLRSFLALHGLASLSSFFKKQYYGTWQHPRSKHQHQLDHIFVLGADVKRFKDAGSCRFGQLIDSDHRAVRCSLRFAVHLQRKLDPRARLTRLDYTPLLEPDIQESFSDKVVSSLGQSPQNVSHTQLCDALNRMALATLPKRERAAPLWFAASEGALRETIDRRNRAFDSVHRAPTPENRDKYLKSRRIAQIQVRRAKSTWITNKCELLNDGFAGPMCGKSAWDVVKTLKGGLAPTGRPPPAKMKKEDGSIASSPEEVAGVFANHFATNIYGRLPEFDPSVLELLSQQPMFEGLDALPSDDEISKGVAKLHATSPGASGLHARLWQALASTEAGMSFIRHFVRHFWLTESSPEEWDTGLLSILPKKGDLSNPGNYRGIIMLEVAYKIVGNILLMRLKPIKESFNLDHEWQNGFRWLRGCMDSIFTVKQLIKKRSEHGLETWLLLIDLVKAFDRVPRELLWEVMLKQGVPPKLVSLLKALHTTVKVKFDVDGATSIMDSIIGVKQGDLLGPDLFIFFMAAVMKTWRSTHDYDLCTVRCNADFQLTGRRPTMKGDLDFGVGDSEYADDTAFAFTSREDCARMTPAVVKHFARWGMEVHVGTDTKGSKSEVLFCAADPRCYKPGGLPPPDLSPIKWDGGFYMPVVDKFKYLGSYLARNCLRDTCDIDSRIQAAGKAFGALRKCLFATASVSSKAKRAVYTTVILSILLYGCECWSLTQRLLDRLRVFHHQCIRSMCRVTRKHTWEHHISSDDLRKRLGLHRIEFYVFSRQLCWLGHVSRMDMERLPRRMLSCWIPHRRPVGRPRLTYGATMKKALRAFGLDEKQTGVPWPELAAKRPVWKSLVCPDSFYNGVTPADAAAALARARKPQTQRTVPVRRRRPAREPATYFQLNVLHYSSGETVLAKAWVRKMRSREPEVRIDIDAMNLIANIQAQTYYSNAIEAHLLNKPHPGLRTEPTPAV